MTSKEFRVVMTLGTVAFLFLFALIVFDVQVNLGPPTARAMSYTLSPTYTYTSTVPGLLSYQGFLADGEGNPLTGNYQMTFAVYSTTVEGIPPLWTETDAEVVVRAGEFSVLLGDENPFPENLFAQPDRYLGVQVESNPEMTPRQRFASVAFAMEASEAELARKVSLGTRLAINEIEDFSTSSSTWVDIPGLTLIAPESGVYLILSHLFIQSSAAGLQRYDVRLKINSDVFSNTLFMNGGGSDEWSTGMIVYDAVLNQGDTVGVVLQSNVGSQTVYGTYTFLRMFKFSESRQ